MRPTLPGNKTGVGAVNAVAYFSQAEGKILGHVPPEANMKRGKAEITLCRIMRPISKDNKTGVGVINVVDYFIRLEKKLQANAL